MTHDENIRIGQTIKTGEKQYIIHTQSSPNGRNMLKSEFVDNLRALNHKVNVIRICKAPYRQRRLYYCLDLLMDKRAMAYMDYFHISCVSRIFVEIEMDLFGLMR